MMDDVNGNGVLDAGASDLLFDLIEGQRGAESIKRSSADRANTGTPQLDPWCSSMRGGLYSQRRRVELQGSISMTLILFLIGLVLLLVGAELLVRGASRLAAAFAIPPLVIGLTVVAFGTSAPELAVSIGAALAGRADLALGNVVGSNIFNVFFILGLSALIAPLAVAQKVVRLEVPIMMGASLLLVVLGWNGAIGRGEGALLVLLGLFYTGYQVRSGRREGAAAESAALEPAKAVSPAPPWWQSVLFIAFGLGLLILGSRWLVNGAVALARSLGLSELIIGLTVIAAGTSLPEVATSVLASLRGERDIAVGNVVGSCIFNILFVLGSASALSSNGVLVSPEAWSFDIPVMVAASVVCLPIFFTGGVIARWEGGLFFAYYLGYTLLLILTAVHIAGLPMFRVAILGFFVPLTGLTLAILATREIKWR